MAKKFEIRNSTLEFLTFVAEGTEQRPLLHAAQQAAIQYEKGGAEVRTVCGNARQPVQR